MKKHIQRKILGDYIGFEESLEHEFKEFTLKSDLDSYLEPHEIEMIARTGLLPDIFNDVIEENLKNYCKRYIPKYISAFSNCEKIDDGYLYFGVNNIGEITGIPYLGKLDKNLVQTLLYKVRKMISLENTQEESVLLNLFDTIEIDVEELDINYDYITEETEKEFQDMFSRYKQYCIDYQIYKQEHAKWIEEISSFTNKISYIALDKPTRQKISCYIREYAPHRSTIAEILESDVYIEILNGVQLNEYKLVDDNIYYWIMFYKDLIIQEIRSRRPIKPNQIYGNFNHIYLEYLRLLTKLRYKFSMANPTCKYYMIRIKIPGKQKNTIYYRHPHYKWRWLTKVRTVNESGPCCL